MLGRKLILHVKDLQLQLRKSLGNLHAFFLLREEENKKLIKNTKKLFLFVRLLYYLKLENKKLEEIKLQIQKFY